MLISVTEFIGRFHPVLVHLPIGILLMGILLQWLSAFSKYSISLEVIKIVLLIGTLTALLSCITGYLLSGSGDYDDDLVSWHMWMGIGVAAASLLFLQRIFTKRNDAATKLTSIALLVLIVLTGHLGGSLTHGSDYLTSALKDNVDTIAKRKPITNIQEARVYADVIQPVLQTKCYGCHNARKQKGGLRMDDPQLLLKGGKDGEVLLPGNPEGSELLKRVLLAREAEHHMPPKSKPQLSEREIALLHWWIETGADFTKKVAEVTQPEKIKPALLALQNNHVQPTLPSNVPAAPVEAADENAIKALRDLGIVVMPVAKGSNYLLANFVTATSLHDSSLQMLLPLKKQLVWLRLSDTKIGNKDLAVVGACSNLTMLYLNNTAVTDGGLRSLKSLQHLQTLSLVGTKVTAGGLAQLAGLKSLRSLYLFGTGTKAADTAALRKFFPHPLIDIGGYGLPVLESDTAKVSGLKAK